MTADMISTEPLAETMVLLLELLPSIQTAKQKTR
jgi:hypothetical protein